MALANGIIKTAHKRTHGGEQNCEYAEAHKLDRSSSPRIDKKECGIVSGDKTRSRKDEIADTDILEFFINAQDALNWGSTEANCLQDDTRVEAETVKCDLSVRGTSLAVPPSVCGL